MGWLRTEYGPENRVARLCFTHKAIREIGFTGLLEDNPERWSLCVSILLKHVAEGRWKDACIYYLGCNTHHYMRWEVSIYHKDLPTVETGEITPTIDIDITDIEANGLRFTFLHDENLKIRDKELLTLLNAI